MPDLFTPLSNEELNCLDEALLNRFDESAQAVDGDEGIIDVTELDGFLAAIVSVPVTILPSQWWPEIWGDYPPLLESDTAFEQLFTWVIRHMNGIAAMLMEQPADFEPMFSESAVDDHVYTIVDEWCEGYMRVIELAQARGASLDGEAEHLLQPIRAFTAAADWPGHDLPDVGDRERLQQAIAPNVRALHAHWLARREDPLQSGATPFRRTTPGVGRNDPCPCGSGRKFKRCCLH